MRAVAISICMAAVFAVLIFLGNIEMGGVIGGGISRALFGMVGLEAYFVPFLIIALIIYLIWFPEKPGSNIILAVFFILFISCAIELSMHASPVGPVNAFYTGYSEKMGGGFAGGLIALGLSRSFGRIGAFVVVAAVCSILAMFMINVVPFTGVLDPKKRRESEKRRKENEKRRRENNRRREEEKKERKRSRVVKMELKDSERTRKINKKNAEKDSRRRRIEAEKQNQREHEESLIRAESRIVPVRGVSSDTLLGTAEEQRQLRDSFPSSPTDNVSELKPGDIPESVETTEEPPREVDVIDLAPSASEPEVSEPDAAVPDDPDLPFFGAERELKPIVMDSIPAEVPDLTEIFPEEPLEEILPETGPEPEEEFLPPDPEPEIMQEPVEDDLIQEEPEEYHPEPIVREDDFPETMASASDKDYIFPPISLLNPVKKNVSVQGNVSATAERLENTLKNFGIDAKITDATQGPTVTRYELKPPVGVKVSKIVNLSDDIKLNLAAADIRIEAPIPGKAAVGIEVPNDKPTPVFFREIVEDEAFRRDSSKIAFSAGKDIGGSVIVSDIAKMPHVLIAGATGAGKSVCINTIIMSILYRAKPDEVKLIMIDPKVVELSVYNGIPHLLIPVVTDPKKAAGALNWAVGEMMERYERFATAGVRDMKGYNSLIHDGMITVSDGKQSTEVTAEKMPQLVVIVDELADLMMVASKEVEEAICRLAQLARAAGIHLVIATQRPSVNVITGLIKANMPSRIAFAVTSGVDSRTILDMTGAEKLLGKGDMLYYPQGFAKPLRVQGAFVTDDEVKRVTDFIRANNVIEETDEQLQDEISSTPSQIPGASSESSRKDDRDQYFEEAARLLMDKEKGSIGMLQRYLKVGFNRASRIMDQLEQAGVVGPEEGTKPRKVIMSEEDFNSKFG